MSRKKLSVDSSALKAVLIFIASFSITIILWIPVKDSYCYVITLAASKLLARIKDAMIVWIVRQGDTFSITLSILKSTDKFPSVVTISGSISDYYAFTVPLTISLIAALSLFMKRRRRAYAETVILLLLSHFLYVFFAETATLTEMLMVGGIEPTNATRLSFYQYLWKATEVSVMSFGPFLIITYVFVRFRR